jgi:hypothetical protein
LVTVPTLLCQLSAEWTFQHFCVWRRVLC